MNTHLVVIVREPGSNLEHRFRFDDPEAAAECALKAMDAGLKARIQRVESRRTKSAVSTTPGA